MNIILKFIAQVKCNKFDSLRAILKPLRNTKIRKFAALIPDS
jgi:hypothetical protein